MVASGAMPELLWLQPMRLAKYLAHAGVASRRAARRDRRAPGACASTARVELDPARDVDGRSASSSTAAPLAGPEERVVYALNKPAGVVSTARDTHGRPTVVELLGADAARACIRSGASTRDSTGLILLTNDGELANLLTHPRYEVPKTYRARVARRPLGAAALRRCATASSSRTDRRRRRGSRLLAAEVIEIELREGRKRQVRRMCERVGHPVLELERVPLRAAAARRARARASTGASPAAELAARCAPRRADSLRAMSERLFALRGAIERRAQRAPRRSSSGPRS